MSRVAILSADSWGEYGYTEVGDFDGDLGDYIIASWPAEIGVCPDDEMPVTHHCNGAAILRITHTGGGESGTETYYSYEAFWAEGGG